MYGNHTFNNEAGSSQYLVTTHKASPRTHSIAVSLSSVGHTCTSPSVRWEFCDMMVRIVLAQGPRGHFTEYSLFSLLLCPCE